MKNTKHKELAIYKFYSDCGRMGSLEGLFVADKSRVKILTENKIEVYFGEVLGKHSEIYGEIDKDEMKIISDNEEIVNLFIENEISSGFNPFHYSVINFSIEGKEDEDYDDLTVNQAIDLLIANQS